MTLKQFVYLASICILFACNKKEETISIEKGSVTDIDGNTYKTVKIGDQWWMAENLRTSMYNDSSSIDQYTLNMEDSLWKKAQVGMFYNIDSLNGSLYNWYVVNSSKKVAPKGWHIPTDEEWKSLERFIGMSETDLNSTAWRGNNLASPLLTNASIGWASTVSVFGTDMYGFNALASGCVVFDGSINSNKNTSFWWTSTSNMNDAWYRYIDGQKNQIFRQHTFKTYGFSIRCVKD
jgi:uncharacterized protein (TIGR02145 family)